MLSAREQMVMWCDGRLSINAIVSMLVPLGYNRGELVDVWFDLLMEGYTQRTVDVLQTRLLDGEPVEIPMTEFILVPPKT